MNLDNIDKKLEATDRDIQYFDKMVAGAENLIRPWKTALIVTNLLWAIVFGAFILFAYLTPTEIDVKQNQEFTEQKQQQNVRGTN